MVTILIIVVSVLLIGGGRYHARGRYGGAGLGSALGWVVVVLVLLSVFGALDGFAPRGMDRDRIGNAAVGPLGPAAKANRANAGSDFEPVRFMIAARWLSTVRWLMPRSAAMFLLG